MKDNTGIGDEYSRVGDKQRHQKQIKPESVEIESGSFKLVSEDGGCVGTKIYFNGQQLKGCSRAVIVADVDVGMIKIHLTVLGTKND